MHNVYVVEDHAFFRMMLQEFIDNMPGLQVTGVSTTGRDALEKIPQIVPDIVIVDLALPDIDGIQVIAELHTKIPEMPTVTLSTYREDFYAQRALMAGARGYIVKGSPGEIETAIRSVVEGEIYLSPNIRDTL